MSDAPQPFPEKRRPSLWRDVAGAALRGKRPGDDVIQRNVIRWMKYLGGGGLAIYISVKATGLGVRAIERSWDKSDAQIAALVLASENLTWTLWETSATQDQRMVALMRALKVAVPDPVKRPGRPEKPEQPKRPTERGGDDGGRG